jgi:three-Cys-motif partner protein
MSETGLTQPCGETRAKREILRRYLAAWLPILGRRHRGRAFPRLIIYDGFAGRGRYVREEHGEFVPAEAGSPLLIHAAAARAVEDGIASEVTLLCSEANTVNYEHLVEELEQFDDPRVEVRHRQVEFADRAGELADWLATRRPRVPTFVFADPFGFRGVPLDVCAR